MRPWGILLGARNGSDAEQQPAAPGQPEWQPRGPEALPAIAREQLLPALWVTEQAGRDRRQRVSILDDVPHPVGVDLDPARRRRDVQRPPRTDVVRVLEEAASGLAVAQVVGGDSIDRAASATS